MIDKMNAAICTQCEAAVPVAEMNEHGECAACVLPKPTVTTSVLLRTGAKIVEESGFPISAGQMRGAAAELEVLHAALRDVRHEICLGPVDDTLWHRGCPAETTVDFICNTLGDDWSYDDWLAEQAAKVDADGTEPAIRCDLTPDMFGEAV